MKQFEETVACIRKTGRTVSGGLWGRGGRHSPASSYKQPRSDSRDTTLVHKSCNAQQVRAEAVVCTRRSRAAAIQPVASVSLGITPNARRHVRNTICFAGGLRRRTLLRVRGVQLNSLAFLLLCSPPHSAQKKKRANEHDCTARARSDRERCVTIGRMFRTHLLNSLLLVDCLARASRPSRPHHNVFALEATITLVHRFVCTQ